MSAESATDKGTSNTGTGSGVLENGFQVYKHLTAAGYKVARNTVMNHITAGKLKPRRGGGFAIQTVDQYARNFLGKIIDTNQELDLPLVETQEPGGYQEARIKADTEYKQAQTRRILERERKEKGLYVPIHIVDREIAERGQGMQLYLSNWIHEVSGDIAAIFGGDDQRSKELVALVNGDESKAQELAGWMFARSSELVSMFRCRLRDALNAYSHHKWFTEEMASAWESYMTGVDGDAEKLIIEAIDLVHGDPKLAANLRTRFILSERDD